MNLYKTTCPNQKAKWSGSQSEAAKDRNAMWEVHKALGKRADIKTEPVVVNTNKDGLIAFLNTHV